MNNKTGSIRAFFRSPANCRYLIIVSIILFIAVLSTAFYLVYQNAEIMRERITADFNRQQLLLARQVAAQIDTGFEEIEMECRNLRRLYISGMIQSPESIQNAITMAASRIKDYGVNELGFADSKGNIIYSHARSNIGTGETINIEDTRLAAPNLFMRLSPLTILKDSAGHFGAFGVLYLPVNRGEKESNIIFARINVSRLIMRPAGHVESGEPGYAWVVDQTGRLIYHPDSRLIGQSAFSTEYRHAPFIFLDEKTGALRDSMLSGKEGTGRYESARQDEGKEQEARLAAYVPVDGASKRGRQTWSVIVTAPAEEITEAVHRVYTRHFIVEAALIASMFVFGWLAFLYQQRVSRDLLRRVSEKEEIIESILNNSVDAIVFIDLENRVEVWNRGAELIFGYTADEMIGETFHRLIPPDMNQDEELRRIRAEVKKNGYLRNYRTRRITKDGRRITIDLSRTLISSKDGRVLGSTAIIKDTTEETQLEQRIYNAEKLASIGTLAAGVAHEINNPLSVILGFTDLLMEKFKPGSPEYEDLSLIEENAQNARRIVENMLGFARVTEGNEGAVDISGCVETVAKIVRSTLKNNKIRLEIDIPKNLPPVRGDTREFQQVIFNLINNAVDAMKDGGGMLTITAGAGDEYVNVKVADTGIGIPNRIERQIFDPFFTSKKVGQGTGLGLSLCYGIVSRYNGMITFESSSVEDNPGRMAGTVFTVTMPIENRDGKSDSEEA